MNHGHRNNYDPLAANFHSRVDYWCAVSPSNSCPLRSAEVERYLVARTGFGLSAALQAGKWLSLRHGCRLNGTATHTLDPPHPGSGSMEPL